jgi:hypothetical protein
MQVNISDNFISVRNLKKLCFIPFKHVESLAILAFAGMAIVSFQRKYV